MSNRNREAGHSFERACAKRFREIGFPKVGCSRALNRSRDAQKVDLVNEDEYEVGRLPYNVQCKNAVSLHYDKVLKELPLNPGIRNVVLHKKTKRAGDKFMPQGTFAYLHAEDFFQMIEEIQTLKAKLDAIQKQDSGN